MDTHKKKVTLESAEAQAPPDPLLVKKISPNMKQLEEIKPNCSMPKLDFLAAAPLFLIPVFSAADHEAQCDLQWSGN